jgi:hypothetical protein
MSESAIQLQQEAQGDTAEQAPREGKVTSVFPFKGRAIKPDISRMINLIVATEPGEVITNQALAAAIGESHTSETFKLALQSAKRDLERSRRIYIQAQRGVGHRVIPDRERAQVAVRNFALGCRKQTRAVVMASSTPMESMDPEERRRHERACSVMQSLVAEGKKTVLVLDAILAPTRHLK